MACPYASVSEVSKSLDEEVKAWRSRRLEKAYPYLVADAGSEKVRQGRLKVA